MSEMDVVIIGGGIGGYVAALKGAQLGLAVTLVEKDQIGGLCLNRGCIPTKALVGSAQAWQYLKNAEQYGLAAENISYDFKKIIKRKDQIVQKLNLGVQSLLKARKVQVIKGKAKILSPREVIVYQENKDKEVIKAKNILIATGSAMREIRVEGIDHPGVIDSDDALSLDELPSKMLIVGGGYTGIEFASLFNTFDVHIEVIDILERILLPVDEEIAAKLLEMMKKRGIDFFLPSQVQKIAQKDGQLSVFLKEKGVEKILSTDKVLISTGRIPDFGGLNIQELGIEPENGGIRVDQYMKTNIPGIYAVGDVVAKKMLAHVASMQGQIAVQHIAGIKKPMSYRVVPFCVFSNPEVASVGLNEQEAREELSDIKIFRFPYRANGKALSINEREGYVKMIANKKDNKIVGVHIIGVHASDLIAEASLALQKGCTASDITETIHAHPTLPETIAETAEGILGHPIHVLR